MSPRKSTNSAAGQLSPATVANVNARIEIQPDNWGYEVQKLTIDIPAGTSMGTLRAFVGLMIQHEAVDFDGPLDAATGEAGTLGKSKPDAVARNKSSVPSGSAPAVKRAE